MRTGLKLSIMAVWNWKYELRPHAGQDNIGPQYKIRILSAAFIAST
jgi:hypothetical protein